MKKMQKKYTILIIVLAFIIVGVIAIFFTMSNFDLSSKTYQNKVFIRKDSDMFFLEPFEMINYNEMDQLKTTSVIYFDENYVYCFVPSNNQAEDYTKIEEYKYKYTITSDQLNFILGDFAYTGHITKDGELELEVIGSNINKDVIGDITKYVVKNEYEYEDLKSKYLENKTDAWNELKETLLKEIGDILGEKKYEKEEENSRYGFQYNSKDLNHPIIVLEKNQEYKDLVVKNIRKITDNMYTITLAENENGDKIFNLVIDGKSSKITTEYLRIKVRTTNPVENAAGIYTKSLQVEFDMNNTSQQMLESSNSNNIKNTTTSDNDYSNNNAIDNKNATKREQLLANFDFYNARGFIYLTEKERQELETFSDTELKERMNKVEENLKIRVEYNNKYSDKLNGIFGKEINVELKSSEDTHYTYIPSNNTQPKAQVEYVAINENGIGTIYYSVEMDLTITDKKQNNEEKITTKKYYKANNINELNGTIKIDNYNTQPVQDEMNNAFSGKSIMAHYATGDGYNFYNAEKYLIYRLPYRFE